jgi:hypothetical protein
MAEEYLPPGTYTETSFDTPNLPTVIPTRIPVFIGTGNEILSRTGLGLVRGSSATIDQRVTEEDMSSRAVSSVSVTGEVFLTEFDGEIARFQVRNFPLVNGDGTGTTTNSGSDVTVTVNGEPTVVLSVDGATGIVVIAATPAVTDDVRCTYFFNREDTLAVDDVSDQVTEEYAIVNSTRSGNYNITTNTRSLSLSVDGHPFVTVSLPVGSAVTPASIVAAVNGASIRTLVASTFTNNLGGTSVRFRANHSIKVGTGSANVVLGLVENAETSRNKTFYTFNGPIVDGSNGGITTTAPSDVVAKVNGVAVTVSSVDGATRAVTLSQAPAPGATVTVQYYWNSWQDTFDYLENRNVTDITRCGLTPDAGSLSSSYIDGVSFVLQNDRIYWGAAVDVSTGVQATGSTAFGSTQVSASLVDNRGYMEPCTPVAGSNTRFQLPFQPTTGNGRGNPLGESLFSVNSNGRLDLPTTNPNLVVVYTGYTPSDALARGAVSVLRVESDTSEVVLATALPENMNVYATFYYNNLVDEAPLGGAVGGYTLASVVPGPGGVGTYTVTKESTGSYLYGAKYVSKGSDLTTIDVNFPSGSEFYSDARIENGTPVEETVRVKFENVDETPARYTFTSPSNFYLIPGASDRLRVTFDGSANDTGLAPGVLLSQPTGGSRIGALAHYVGSEVVYDPTTGSNTFETVSGVNDGISLVVDGAEINSSVGSNAAADLSDFANAINTASALVAPYYDTATTFSSLTITSGVYDSIALHYTGDVNGPSGNIPLNFSNGTYATPALLASHINTMLGFVNGGGGLMGTVTCTATSEGRLRFSLSLAPGDTAGFLEFIDYPDPSRDSALLFGIDTAPGTLGAQTKIVQAPIASVFSVTADSSRMLNDRLILRNRILPGKGSLSANAVLAQTGIQVLSSTGNTLAGLETGTVVPAVADIGYPYPSLLGVVGWSGGQSTTFGDARDGQPLVTFYDGSDTEAANNVFSVVINGQLVTTTFTATGPGTATALGPVGVATSVLGQIRAALTAGSLSTSYARQEGAGIRLEAPSIVSLEDYIEIGGGSANSVLGFSEGQISTVSSATAWDVVSALMSHQRTQLGTFLFGGAPDSKFFYAKALAYVQKDDSNAEYVQIQSRTLGVSSSIKVEEASSDDVMSTGSGFTGVVGTTFTGRAPINGFYVTSSTPDGSGSANTSILNDGDGQDGFVGQTYRDAVTGLTFTILPREGGLQYPTTSNATLSFRVSRTHTTNGVVPVLTIPGVELLVANTSGVTANNTAIVSTFDKDGDQPSIGQVYYVDYDYIKSNYDAKLFSRISDVEAEYGSVSPDNPLSLAADLAFRNGQPVIALKQVRKDLGSSASESSYLTALNELAGASLPNRIRPTVLTFLTPATSNLLAQAAIHCDLQSSKRFQSERTAIFGCGAGTTPTQVRNLAKSIKSRRVRILYPDIATLVLRDSNGRNRTHIVDGRYMAAALAARVCSPSVDVATPWESFLLSGFASIGRNLDDPTKNLIANDGVTIMDFEAGSLVVRHGLTTDMATAATKIPTIIQIADEMQIRTRSVLSRFKRKFTPDVYSEIEGKLSAMFKNAVKEQIVLSFSEISAVEDPEDPTGALVEATYAAVYPFLKITVRYRVRPQGT